MTPQFAAALQLFPLILPIWLERPIADLDIRPGPYPIEVLAEEIAMQREALGVGTDYDLRCQVVKHLRQTGKAEAFAILVDHLQRETNPRVLATLAQQLCAMSFRSEKLEPLVKPMLVHADAGVRRWACELYGSTPGAQLTELMRRALEDEASLVREAACQALAKHVRRLKIDFFAALWEDPVAEVRAETLVAALGKPESDAYRENFLQACDEASPVVVRYRIAHALDTAPEDLRTALVRKLVRDSHASVRGAVAEAIGQTGHDALLPLLLQLETDSDPEVRRLMAANLARFPAPSSVAALVRLLADPRSLVRFCAADSLVALDPQISVHASVAARLEDRIDFVRFHAIHVLGRLAAEEYAQQVARRLPLETIPRNVAAAVFALGQFEARFAADSVAALGKHDSPIVREEVARALGRLLVPSTYAMIKTLIFDGNDDVRQAAFIAAGRTGDGQTFNESIPKALRIFNDRQMTSRNRGAACWCAGRLRPVAKEVIDRLVTQATVPVVPNPPGPPELEVDYILVTAAFALAACARDDPTFVDRAKYVIGKHSYKGPADTRLLPEGITVFSAEVQEYARQCRAYLEHEPVFEQMPRPTRRLSFNYGRYEPPADH